MAAPPLNAVPIQRLNLLDIDNVPRINESDYGCMAEVRDVLRKHGKQTRLGIALLHKHFDLRKGEVLVETTDPVNRVSTIQPVKASEAGNAIETIWALLDGENEALLGCRQYCGTDVHGNHNSFHSQT